MKTLHTIYNNFAKRVLMALALITMGVGTAWGDTWTWTASNQNELGTSTSYSATLNDKTWSVERSSVQHTGMTGDCIQLGKKGGAETVTLESSAFEGTIKSVSVECASYDGAHKITISVGGTEYLSASTSSWQTVSSNKGEGDSSGQIQIKFTAGSGARALYIKSITVEYNAGGNQPDPEEPDEELCGWVATDINNISSTDLVVITMTNSSGTYAMSNDNGTSSAPAAVKVDVEGTSLTSEITDNIKWGVGGSTNAYTFYPNGDTQNWLYATSENNGVRVGTNTNKTFKIDATSGYLVHIETSRYIGVYNSQNWRCYTTVHENIQNQTLKFYKYVPCAPTETTISFDANGGAGGPSSVTATKNEQMPSIASSLPSRTGYTFKGYYDAQSGGTKYYNADGTSAKEWDKDDAEYTLYAQWTAQQYNIIYKDQGNVDFSGSHEEGAPTQHTYGTATTLKDATKTGYTFGDWYKESDCSGTAVTTLGATEYTENITLYAQWTANTYTVQFNANGGTGTMDSQSFTYDVAQNLSANTFTRTGYNFTGWNTADDGTGTPYADNAEVQNLTSEPNGEVTLYAQWEEKQLTNFRTLCEYTVTWELAGGQIDGNTDDIVDTYTNGQEIQKPADPTRVGHRFLGWTPDFVEGTKMQSQSLVYTALWFELVVTQLQWSEDSYTARMEADNDFPDLTILPNDFAGELTYQSSDPAVATIAADGTITLVGTGTTTITASIAADDTYLAASDSYELTVVESNCKWVEVTDNTTLEDGDEVVITMTYGKSYALPNARNTSSAPSVTDVSTYIDGNELNYNADDFKWTVEKKEGNYIFHPANNATLNLYCNNADDGVRVGSSTNALTNQEFSVSGNYLLNNATSRYLGVSFNTNPHTWRCYKSTTGVIADETLKFYKRVCLDNEHYWLTWDATDGQFADGTKQIMKDYAVGTIINKPLDPTRIGYDFAGWSTDGVNVVTPEDKMPEENLIYSAVWQIKSYTVTWDADGGQFADGKTVIEQTYEYGATITRPANPTRVGYTFKGWSPNVPDKMSTDNLKFVAQWQVNQYTVTWNPEGGHWGDSFAPIVENYNYGAPINRPANPEKAGYVFDKWEPDVVATMPNNNLTYTAKWNKAFCDAFTFHTGDADVWNKPQEQICFEYKANHEWQIINYVIPISDAQSHFLVADRGWPQIDQGSLGGHSKSATSTWSATMYLAPSMDSNDGNGSPKVGHAKGAVGTLRIFDDSNWDNLYVGFIPNGYKLKFGANEYDFEHYGDAEYRSGIVEYNATTANNNVSVGVINTSNAYVKTDHTQEGMRHIFLKDNVGWKDDNAKIAIYYWDNNGDGWSKFMKTIPGETDMYEGWIPDNYTNFKFVRLKNDAGTPNWENKWNETGNLTLKTDKTLYTIPSGTWDGADDNNWSTYQRKGKFRIYNNSWDKNWYVNFYPHYVITFDKNATDATGTMSPQALPLDANPMTMVLNACAFERRGYDFTGWKTDVAITADGANVAANGNVKDKATISNINKDITLKAQWKAQAYTITYKDQGDVAYSGENLASLPQTHTYDQMTTLVAGVKTGYIFDGWYTTPECDGTAVTELGAQDYIADITLYAKWIFAMEYNITNTETIFITSAKGQKIKATTPIVLSVNNMPVGTKVAISAPNITFYDEAGNVVTDLTTKSISESFSLSAAYTPTEANITEQQPTITLSVLGNEKTIEGLISARSLPETFAVVAKVGNVWYALPSQGLNSTTPPAAYPVEVDDMADPTTVTAVPANADWSLRQVLNDRFTANGDNLVFVNNASPAMTLNASTSGNYLLTDAQYDNTNPGLYEWTPTTTDLETYQLTNEQRSRTLSVNTAIVFGVHAQNKAVEQVRFLPIQNRYTPLTLQVVEWKENSVVVMYNGNPAQTASVSVNGSAAEETILSSKDAQCDIAVYELTATGLAANPTQRLSITIGSEKTILSIPYIIINSETTDVAVLPGTTVAARQEVAKVSDLVILKGATLTAAGAKGNPYKFRNVTVYGGGKLVVPADNGFGVNSLTLRAGGVTADGNYDYVYPEFVLNGKYTSSSGKINLDYVTTKEQYYTFVAPFAVQTTDIHYPVDIYGNNVDAANKGSFEFEYYDGATRATGVSGWTTVEEGAGGATLKPGQGYTFLGMPKKVSVNGGSSTRQKFGIHRIPMTVTAEQAMTHENSEQTITVAPHPAEKNINAGWNLIGNPYMSTITGLDNQSIQTGTIVWEDNKWEWSTDDTYNQRFIVFPSNDGQWYTTAQASNATLPAFKNFFVQIANNANALVIPYTSRTNPSAAPARHAAEEIDRDIELAIVLEKDEQNADQMDFLLNNTYGPAFDRNADFTKMMNNTNFNLYGVHLDDCLSFVAIDQYTAAQPVAIGYQVPTAGEYMLRISDKPYVMADRIKALYVTDHEMTPEVTTDILKEPYRFTVGKAETNHTRFTISIELKPNTGDGVTTGWENVDVGKDQPIKFIYQDKLYILRNGVIYDAMGKFVQTINK